MPWPRHETLRHARLPSFTIVFWPKRNISQDIVTYVDFIRKARGSMNESLVIRRPDDWHVHLRAGDMLRAVLPFTARQFARAIVMPNLSPPVTTTALARTYREQILALVPGGADFTPLMTAYLTD